MKTDFIMSCAISIKDALVIARDIMPDRDDDFLGYLIWNYTGYPSFFMNDPIREITVQLRKASRRKNI